GEMGVSRAVGQRQESGRTQRSPTLPGAPDISDDSRCAWFARQQRIARHKRRRAQGARAHKSHDQVPPTSWSTSAKATPWHFALIAEIGLGRRTMSEND